MALTLLYMRCVLQVQYYRDGYLQYLAESREVFAALETAVQKFPQCEALSLSLVSGNLFPSQCRHTLNFGSRHATVGPLTASLLPCCQRFVRLLSSSSPSSAFSSAFPSSSNSFSTSLPLLFFSSPLLVSAAPPSFHLPLPSAPIRQSGFPW